ncbi:MAG: WbqC family protein [Owenweeksia sp.]
MLLSTTYLGPVSYYQAMVSAETIELEAWESWQKQSYRNRCYIDSPNGRLMLSIPVQASSTGLVKDVRISYKDNWPQKHWQAIKTTYNTSPFFEVLGPDINTVYNKRPRFLWDLNYELMQIVLDWLQHTVKIKMTGSWQENRENDLRESFHPKRESTPLQVYPQVFDHKNNFLSNLSVIDLLFNEGPAAPGYLKRL